MLIKNCWPINTNNSKLKWTDWKHKQLHSFYYSHSLLLTQHSILVYFWHFNRWKKSKIYWQISGFWQIILWIESDCRCYDRQKKSLYQSQKMEVAVIHTKHKNNYYEMNASACCIKLSRRKKYAQFVFGMLKKICWDISNAWNSPGSKLWNSR